MTGNMKIEGEKEVQAVFTRMIKYYPTRVVAAGIRKAMAPFTNRAKALNPRFGHLYKAKVMNKKRNVPVIVAGAFKGKKGRNGTGEERANQENADPEEGR